MLSTDCTEIPAWLRPAIINHHPPPPPAKSFQNMSGPALGTGLELRTGQVSPMCQQKHNKQVHDVRLQ